MEEALKDRFLTCKDCHHRFPFAVQEQKAFGQKGWADPVRCHYCRRQKKVLNLILKDGVNVSEEIKSSEICDKCGRSYFSKIKRKLGVTLYCDDCWVEIKAVKPVEEQNEN